MNNSSKIKPEKRYCIQTMTANGVRYLGAVSDEHVEWLEDPAKAATFDVKSAAAMIKNLRNKHQTSAVKVVAKVQG